MDNDVIDYLEMLDDQSVIDEVAEVPERKYEIRPRIDHYYNWKNEEFFVRFRLSQRTVDMITNQIRLDLENRTQRNQDRAVQPRDQLLLTLRFLATGNFYVTIGDFSGVHKSTAGKIIRRVIRAICNLRAQYIKMPEDRDNIQNTMRGFFELSHFPRVVGAIDCTHIKVLSPGGQEAELFRNRKGWFSLNVQVICDHDYKIIDIVTRWPGSSHDTHIFNNSAVKSRFERGDFDNGLLVGDSGYPSLPYMMTPLQNPVDEGENLYNEAQIRTRNIIERLFGIWKRRFPILSTGIRTKLGTAQQIIVACAILQIIARQEKEEDFEDEGDVEGEPTEANEDQDEEDGNNEDDGGNRLEMIEYFRNLLLNQH